MSNRTYLAVVPSLLLVFVLIGAGALLNRVDVVRKEARNARDHAQRAYENATVYRSELTSLQQHANVMTLELAKVRVNLGVCKRRTEWLRLLFHKTTEDGAHTMEEALPGFPTWEEK